MVILLQDIHFDELFSILEILDKLNTMKERQNGSIVCSGDFKSQEKQSEQTERHQEKMDCSEQNAEENVSTSEDKEKLTKLTKVSKENQAQRLCQLMWELLCLLPTNPSILNRLKYFERFLTSGSEPKISDTGEQEHSYQGFLVPWGNLLDPFHPHKLLYCLQVVDLIHFSFVNKHAQPSKSSSESSDTSDEETDKATPLATWGSRFVEFGGLLHLHKTLMNGHLEVARCGDLWTPWQEECLAYLLKLICEFGTIKNDDDEDEVFSGSDGEQHSQLFQHKDGRFRVRYKSTDKEETIFIKCLSQVSNTVSLKSMILCDVFDFILLSFTMY